MRCSGASKVICIDLRLLCSQSMQGCGVQSAAVAPGLLLLGLRVLGVSWQHCCWQQQLFICKHLMLGKHGTSQSGNSKTPAADVTPYYDHVCTNLQLISISCLCTELSILPDFMHSASSSHVLHLFPQSKSCRLPVMVVNALCSGRPCRSCGSCHRRA